MIDAVPESSPDGNRKTEASNRLAARAGRYLTSSADLRRRPPTPGSLARRRIMITLTKWLLPAGALALLATVALWPELDRATDQSRLSLNGMSGKVDGAVVTDASFRSVDERGRPYTVTASEAHQIGPEQIDLVNPKGDMTQENGTWLMVQSKQGTYMQRASQLDLSVDVVLYRDDGTTMKTNSTTVDLKQGAASGSEPVHVEGPFGQLDAKGFTLTDKGAAIQFTGPGHVILNAVGQ